MKANTMNYAKIVRYNLKKPLDQRVNLCSLARRVSLARHRGNMMALLANIHAEIEPARAAREQLLSFE